MSIFTYIFFPREVDDPRYLSNCYIHNISYEKADNMGFIPWFAQWNEELLFKRKYYSISILPSDFKFSFANEKVFKYEMRGNFIGTIDKKRSMSSNLKDLESVDEELSVNLNRIISDYISRHQLYHLINDNIESGESVEIYSQWLDWDAPDIWGPPEHIYELSLKEIFDNRKFYISTEKNDLYIIHKP